MELGKSKIVANVLSLGVLGGIEASWAPMVPFVKAHLQYDDAQFGNMLLAMGVGSVCALPTVGPLISKFGPRLVALAAGSCLALSLIAISFVLNPFLLPFFLALFGASLIALDVSANVNAVVIEKEFNRPIMSGLHGGYSFGTIVGSLFMALLLSLGFNLTLSAVIDSLLIVGAMFIFCRSLEKDVSSFNDDKGEDEKGPSKKYLLILPPAILILGSICFIAYGTEGAVLSWATVFATQNRGIDPTVAGYFYIFYAVAMTISRFSGNKIVKTIGSRKTVVIGGVMVCLGFFIAAMVQHQVGMMIGFFVVGLGAGNVIPQLISFAGNIKGVKVQTAISFITALGYSGILLGPVIIGHVSKFTSLEVSFEMLGVGFLIVAAVSFFLLKVKKD